MSGLPTPGGSDVWGTSLNDAIKSVNIAGLESALPASGDFTGQQYTATDTGKIRRWNGSAWVVLTTSGGLLASTTYKPATATLVTAATTTGADVDATNLAVTFTVPASGAVIVVLAGFAVGAGTAGQSLSWCVREGAANVADTEAFVTQNAALVRATHRVKITGLTPGASKTYKWGHYCNATSTVQRTGFGDYYGQALMEVRAA